MPGTHASITSTVGNTPLVALQRVTMGYPARILTKLEYFNPSGSIKDRIALAMIEDAEERGVLKAGGTVIEPTSGNTGIALAFVSASKGYRCILTSPSNMCPLRRQLLQALGAEVELTPPHLGMQGAIDQALFLQKKILGGVVLQQFENPANPAAHFATTAQELWDDTDGNIDVFVAGVGTGGTITGVGSFFKARNPNFKLFAVEPTTSPVISGRLPGPHGIEGIGAGFIPPNLDRSLLDGVVLICDEEAFKMGRRLAREEGLFAGISSGANVAAALKLAARPEFKGKTIATVLCSTGERYLSTPLYSRFAKEPPK